MEVAFDRRGLVPLAVVAAACAAGGAAMVLTDAVLIGVPVPAPLRATLGLAAVALGTWFAVAVVSRARSADPAARVEGDGLLLHVNPGRRLVLGRDEVRSVGPVRPVPSAVRRWVLGGRAFEIATTRPEGLRASSVLVGSRFVAGDLQEVRDRLAAALQR